MSLKQRATKCSGYIPNSQYVPVYSRPIRSTNVRKHEELSPITPKPDLDDPDNIRSRTIHQAVKAWLESSPNSVIGRGRSPTDSPRTSDSSFDRANATPSDGEVDYAYNNGTFESPTFQTNRLKPLTGTVSTGGDVRIKDDADLASTHNYHQKYAREENTAERREGVPAAVIASAAAAAIIASAENDFDPSLTAVKSSLHLSGNAPERFLKPSRVLERTMGHEGDQKLPHKKVTFDCPGATMDETRGKQREDFPAPAHEERRFGDDGLNEVGSAPMGAKDDFASDSEFVSEEANIKSGFGPSITSSHVPVYEERRFGDDGMDSTITAPEAAKSSVAVDSGVDNKSKEVDAGVDDRTSVKAQDRRRNYQLLYGTDGSNFAANPQMASRQGERYESQTRSLSTGSVNYNNVGKRDGPTKTAAVVPVPEESNYNSNLAQEEMLTAPLEIEDSNQTQLKKQPSSKQMAMERLKKDKFLAKAAAWEEAKNSEFLNRYKREETKIVAWEDHKKEKAAMNMKKVEMKLQEKRSKAMEKMENEMAKAHKKAEERKAIAEAKRAEKAAKAAEEAEIIRQQGRKPLSLFCFQ